MSEHEFIAVFLLGVLQGCFIGYDRGLMSSVTGLGGSQAERGRECPGSTVEGEENPWRAVTVRDPNRAMRHENEQLRAALEKLRSCAHACGPAPCPHTRKYDEATKGLNL